MSSSFFCFFSPKDAEGILLNYFLEVASKIITTQESIRPSIRFDLACFQTIIYIYDEAESELSMTHLGSRHHYHQKNTSLSFLTLNNIKNKIKKLSD
jgi:hypothetical protein